MKASAVAAAVSLGEVVRWQGGTYLVTALQGSSAYLLSQSAEGEDATVLVDALLNAPDFAVLTRASAGPEPRSSVGRRSGEGLSSLALLEGLPEAAQADVTFWLDHVLEVHTGLPGFAGADAEPRACYDPARTTLRERYATKAAELQVAHYKVSAATVERKRLAWLAEGVWGLVDKRRLRSPSEHGRVDERVIELLHRVYKRLRNKSEGVHWSV